MSLLWGNFEDFINIWLFKTVLKTRNLRKSLQSKNNFEWTKYLLCKENLNKEFDLLQTNDKDIGNAIRFIINVLQILMTENTCSKFEIKLNLQSELTKRRNKVIGSIPNTRPLKSHLSLQL